MALVVKRACEPLGVSRAAGIGSVPGLAAPRWCGEEPWVVIRRLVTACPNMSGRSPVSRSLLGDGSAGASCCPSGSPRDCLTLRNAARNLLSRTGGGFVAGPGHMLPIQAGCPVKSWAKT
ncbi:hypothetical protein HNR40_001532 [Nonomuraea endophytica]|uniref:Uncharacterized protein n=1 Tax=Nonomuraea endophytica TaxID=714136 RepID=A0A7W7ZZF2_9ACTN|nr:hypothetical protein [Nonomuraea endophytica]